MFNTNFFESIKKNKYQFELYNNGLHYSGGFNIFIISNNYEIPLNTDIVYFKNDFNVKYLNKIYYPNRVKGIIFSNSLNSSLDLINLTDNINYIADIRSFGNLINIPNSIKYIYLTDNFSDNLNKFTFSKNIKKITFNGKFDFNLNNLNINSETLLSFNFMTNDLLKKLPFNTNIIELTILEEPLIFPESINEVIYNNYDIDYYETEDYRLSTLNRYFIEKINDNNNKFINISSFLNKNCIKTIQNIY